MSVSGFDVGRGQSEPRSNKVGGCILSLPNFSVQSAKRLVYFRNFGAKDLAAVTRFHAGGTTFQQALNEHGFRLEVPVSRRPLAALKAMAQSIKLRLNEVLRRMTNISRCKLSIRITNRPESA